MSKHNSTKKKKSVHTLAYRTYYNEKLIWLKSTFKFIEIIYFS